MAWPFGGNWEGRPLSDLAEILASLFRALNERREAIALTPTTFQTSDGPMTYPEKENLRMALNGDTALANWGTFQTSFAALVGPSVNNQWYTTTAFTTKYTHATLESAAGLQPGDIFITPTKATDLYALQGIQDLFDLLVFRRATGNQTITPLISTTRRLRSATGSLTPANSCNSATSESVWDTCRTGAVTTSSVSFNVESFSMLSASTPGSPTGTTNSLIRDFDIRFQTNTFSGDVVFARFQMAPFSIFSNSTPQAMTLNGVSNTPASSDLLLTSAALSTNELYQFRWTVPVDIPFNGGACGKTGSISAFFNGPVFDLDLRTILTDQ